VEHSVLTLSHLTIQIDRIIAGGDGLARQSDGPVVFVPRTAPGDRVEVEIVEEHRQWARGSALQILEPGAERREAVCPYYDVCGGCQLQHLEYEAQLQAKSSIISDALKRLGGIDVGEPETVGSALEFDYRNRVTFVLKRNDGEVVAGFHALEKGDDVVDIERCPLAEPAINRVWSALRAAWGPGAERLPAGDELRLTLRATRVGEVGLTIGRGEGDGQPDELLPDVEGLSTIWRLALQVNRGVAEKLDAYVREQLQPVAGQRIIDAYCGFGLRSLQLAWQGARVVGIDTDEEAIANAAEAATESGASARFVPASVEDVMAWELPSDLVVLNPPRRGVGKAVVQALLKDRPARIVYVSCDPATLARDLKALSSRFEVTAIRGFDMFPQTAHVETVVTLDRATASSTA
jgi:23S rRNA (uracil1939-C5)-methyltransferase